MEAKNSPAEGDGDMAYRRLDYQQYFIDTSEDYNHTGKARRPIHYTSKLYESGRLARFLGIRNEVNYEMHFEPDRNVIQINFQKTNGGSDWFSNVAEFSSKYYDAFEFDGAPLTLYVHHGWGNMYKSIKHEIRDGWSALIAAHPTAETEIVGWSLGSGQAMLCCQDLNYNFGLRSHVFTFGSVRPFQARKGGEERLKKYLASLYVECRNFAIGNDIVTYMPPFRGFSMMNREDIGGQRRTLFRLLNPLRFHTIYDDPALYAGKE